MLPRTVQRLIDEFSRLPGIGPKTALKLVQNFGRIEAMPPEVQEAVGDPSEVRTIYLRPDVTDDYPLDFGAPDIAGILDFLCGERQFSRERVAAALERAFPQRPLF